jgi:hypothetical protein
VGGGGGGGGRGWEGGGVNSFALALGAALVQVVVVALVGEDRLPPGLCERKGESGCRVSVEVGA